MNQASFESALMRAPLLAGMATETRASIVTLFQPFSFDEGSPIVRAGDSGRYLGVLISGSAVVQARREERAFTVEFLEPGRIFGEIAFFDPQSPRTADIIGTAEGVAAMLAFQDYARLVEQESEAAAMLEKNVLDLLGRRIHATNETLGELLEATRRGTFLDSIRSFFGGRG